MTWTTLLRTTFGVAVGLSVSIIGVLSNTNNSLAAPFQGDFQLSSGSTLNGNPNNNTTTSTLAELSLTSLNFSPQSVTPIALTAQTGSFTDFNTASIGGINFNSPSTTPFLDFGRTAIPGVVGFPNANEPSLIDGINTFTVRSANYVLAQIGANVGVDVDLNGFFTNANGETSLGRGSLSLQINDAQLNDILSILNSGQSIQNLAFSGGLFARVPEPTMLLGLGLVGAVFTIYRRRTHSCK
ncbi:MAG TPA: PEP-CTERM sorting domain-containing protein [Nostocaceae cyanobacterium]|nr:PEP-CTERM sorting domain-containing protein [Nostocaceae cyanobacterium]